jgi:hypothetical protein
VSVAYRPQAAFRTATPSDRFRTSSLPFTFGANAKAGD